MDTEIVAAEKTCSRCRLLKPVADFAKSKNLKDGLSIYCKSCKNAALNQWRDNNREQWKTLNKASREKRVKNGLCVICGKASERGTQECYECLSRRHRKKRPYRQFAGPCVVCGFEYSDVHHKDGNHANNEEQNLVPLCPNHHRLVHMKLLELS